MDEELSAGSCAGLRVLVLSPTPTHPQDFGNRKRIFQVCSRYASEGARISFAHYPAENEWQRGIPLDAQRAMQRCWDRFYTISPTRALHSSADGHHFRIDEWWDESIGHFLRWIFTVQSFDIFIVNYSWLSKAFEYVPSSVFKILDTHDKVSGRREMLATLGLAPEFFYTTEAEETVALRRADLVWSIKNEERVLFERMSATPVLTLPHLDPARVLERAAPDPDGYLRVGVIGARNNVNRVNLTQFLNAAKPVFEDTFAPVKVVVAGSVCDLMEDTDNPFVEFRGRVNSVEGFYRTVDCVAVPMRASTGLKIKTGEALSLGLPVLSLAHAFEGYEPADPMHVLQDFPELSRALADLAFAPREALDALADASRKSHAQTAAQIAATFQKTDALARRGNNRIVIAVDSRAFVTGTVFNLVLGSIQEYLRGLGNVTILVVRGSAAHVVGNPEAIAVFQRIIVARDIDGAMDARAHLAALDVDTLDVEAYLRLTTPKMLVADALHPALMKAWPETAVFARGEMIAFSEGRAAVRVPGRGYKCAFVAAPGPSSDAADLAALAGATTVLSACFRRGVKLRVHPAELDRGRKTLVLLGAPGEEAVTVATAMAQAWGLETHVVHGFSKASAGEGVFHDDVTGIDDYVDSLLSGRRPAPHFAIDLSDGATGLLLGRELLERLRVPTIAATTITRQRSPGIAGTPYRVATECELWNSIRELVVEPADMQQRRIGPVLSDLDSHHDLLWRLIKGLFAGRVAVR